MKTWKSIEAIGAQTEASVLCEKTGEQGRVAVRWNNGNVNFYGPVFKITKRYYNEDGSEYQNPEVIVLDSNPTFA